MADASGRIRERREQKEKLEIAAVEAGDLPAERRHKGSQRAGATTVAVTIVVDNVDVSGMSND